MRQFIVDAFESGPFTGNPAAVVPLESWPDDGLLQRIAAENNLSETAFFAPAGNDGAARRLRWFTPAQEVELCGHATLAAAHVLFAELGEPAETLSFDTRSGRLGVGREGDALVLDFPAVESHACEDAARVLSALRVDEGEVLAARDGIVAVVDDPAAVRCCAPDFAAIAEFTVMGVMVTARGETEDFVYRMFAPRVGIDEDPATGSAQCMLAPLWAGRLGKKDLTSSQLSARTGAFRARWHEGAGRVDIAGRCRTFARCELLV